jgi:hypothetical protein
MQGEIMLKRILGVVFASALLTGYGSALSLAQEESEDTTQSGSDMEQLEDAVEDGQEAVGAETEEEAKEESNATFDTPHDSDGD